jgi:hypothetical protein
MIWCIPQALMTIPATAQGQRKMQEIAIRIGGRRPKNASSRSLDRPADNI